MSKTKFIKKKKVKKNKLTRKNKYIEPNYKTSYITDRDKWENKRLFFSIMNEHLDKKEPKYGAELVNVRSTSFLAKSKHYLKKYYLFLRIKINSKNVYLRLTESQVETIFNHMANEIRTNPGKLFKVLSDLGSREKDQYISREANLVSVENITPFKKIKDTMYRGVDVYEGPLFVGYLVKQDDKPYEKELKDSKVYLDVGGWFVSNTQKNGYINCNPKKYTKKIEDAEKVKFKTQCYFIEKYRDTEFLFLDIIEAAANDFVILMNCDTSNAWKDRYRMQRDDYHGIY